MSNLDRNLPAAVSAIPGPLGIVAFLVLLGLIGLGSRQPGGPPGQSEKASTPSATEPSADDHGGSFAPLRLLLDYLENQQPESGKTAEAAVTLAVQSELRLANEKLTAGLSLDSPAGADSPKQEPLIAQFHRELSKIVQPARNLQLECLIALVPDPIDSHFPLMFDNALASIHKGFEAHGFVRDRYVLLWQEAVAEGANKSRSAVRNWRKQPSAILFRKKTADSIVSGQADVNQLVLLLLVGETPTTGVHKQALQTALDFVAAYEMVRVSEPGEVTAQIHVLGPEYSGSASSLRIALCNWWDDLKNPVFALSSSDGTPDRNATLNKGKIQVLSGSATADDNLDVLKFNHDGLTVNFQATVLPDGPATRAVLDYLIDERRIPDKRIAFLTEATSYGNVENIKNDKYDGVRFFRFPISLSRMRSEYERSKASRESPQSSGPRPASVRRNLDLDSESTGHTIDAIPTFSNATPATSDLSLEHVLATIKRDRIQAVGIMATDVQDVLFLAKQIRMHTSDVLLFTFESEILYTHADHTPYLEGMLVASTYPLFTRNRTWSHQPRLESSFAQGTSHGVFNATIVQLNRLLKDKALKKDNSIWLLDYAIPFTDQQHVDSRPPLWLTMVADTGFWPLATIPDTKQDRDKLISTYTYPPKIIAEAENIAEAEQEPWPSTAINEKPYIARPSLIPSVTISAFGLIFAGLIGLHNFTTRSRARNKNSPASWLERACRWMSLRKLSETDAAEPVVPMRCFVAATFLGGLLFLLLSLASPVWVWQMSQLSTSHDRPTNGALATFLIALATVTAVLALVLWLWGGSLKHRGMLLVWLSLAGLLFLLLCRWLPLASTDVSKAIFIERVGELDSGVSPLVPITCVIGVIMLWAVCHWRREYFCEIYKLANPLFLHEHSEHAGGSTPIHLAGIKPRFDHLEQRLQSPFWLPTEPMDWVFSLFLAVNLGYIAVYWISTAEGFWFDCLFGLATLLAAACFWNLYLHLKATCGLFERLLRRLGQHAMVSAYERVPQRLRDKVAGQIFSAAPHAGDLDQAVRCLRRLAGHAATKEDRTIVKLPEVEQFQAEVVAIQAKLASALDLDRSKKEFVLAEAAEMNHHMAQIAGKHLVRSLLSYWDEKPVIEPKQSKKESGGNSSQETPQQLWLEEAETFVAIQVVHLIRQVFTHIQNLLTFLVLMLFWLLVCSESYPFVPHRLIQLSATWLVIWVLAAIIIFMVKFNRNEILSRINNTTPNRFTLDRSFMLTLITYVLIPAVGVLAVQFPPLGRILFGWLNNIRKLSGM